MSTETKETAEELAKAKKQMQPFQGGAWVDPDNLQAGEVIASLNHQLSIAQMDRVEKKYKKEKALVDLNTTSLSEQDQKIKDDFESYIKKIEESITLVPELALQEKFQNNQGYTLLLKAPHKEAIFTNSNVTEEQAKKRFEEYITEIENSLNPAYNLAYRKKFLETETWVHYEQYFISALKLLEKKELEDRYQLLLRKTDSIYCLSNQFLKGRISWISHPNYYLKALALLGKKGASYDFNQLIQSILIFNPHLQMTMVSIIKTIKDHDTFFVDCGKNLLISAILNYDSKLLDYLINEINISPNFDLNGNEFFRRPLFAVLNWRSKDRAKYFYFRESILKLLFKTMEKNTGYLVSEYYCKNDFAISLGNPPYQYVDGNDEHWLIKELLYNGLSLLQRNENSKKFLINLVPENINSQSLHLTKIFLRYGAGLLKKELYSIHDKITDKILRYQSKNSTFPQKYPVRPKYEIIFWVGTCDSSFAYTITKVVELRDFLLNDEEEVRFNQITYDKVCKSVLDADPDDLVPGVLQAFSDYRARKAPHLFLTGYTLHKNHALPMGATRIIADYIEPTIDLTDSAFQKVCENFKI